MRRAAYLLWMAGAVGAVAAAPLGVGLAQTAAPVAECDLNLQDARHWLEPNFAGAGQGAAVDDFAPDPWDGATGHLLALTLLYTYRNTLARTDLDLCAFRPSCSRFAQLAIDEFGFVRGILLGTDRLLRDGPSALDYGYAPAGDGRHLLDPIADYLDRPCLGCGASGGPDHE